MDDRSGGDPVGGGPALAGLWHHPPSASGQRRGRILGRTPGGQRHRCAEGQAGDQGPGETRWEVDHPGGARVGAGRRHPPAPGRHRAGGCAPAGGRPGRGGSVRADGRIAARHAQTRRGGVFRFDHSSGRNRRAGLCHGREHLFRQDGATGAGGAHRQPFSTRGAEDRQLPDHPRGGSGGGDHCRRDLPRRPDPHHVAVRPGADRGRDSRGDADGAVGDDGGRRAPARQERGDCEPAGGHRGIGGRGRAVRGQDRHADPEQADAGRSVQREQYPRRASHPRRRAGVARGQ